MTGQTFHRQVNGVRLFERRVGSGPETIVLHGGPGAHHDYLRPGFDRLANGRTLVYYDQRGGGQSPVERDVAVGWQEQVADLEALRGTWGLERLPIVGYSWGAMLALLYAVSHPDRVDRLALVSPAPVWREARAEFERRFAERSTAAPITRARAELQASGLKESDPNAYRQRLFELSVAGYFHDWRKASELTPFRITGRTQQAVWESLGNFDLRQELSSLSVPTIVVHGDDDPIPMETAQTLADLLKARFIPIAGSGHVPYVERPDEFVAAVDPFLPRAS